MDIYELNRSKDKYKDMKEYIEKMIYILSYNGILDKLSKVQSCLDKNYLVNDSACKYNKVGSQKEKITSALSSLKSIRDVIDGKISDINDDIEKNEELEM